MESLAKMLEKIWETLVRHDIDLELLLSQSLLSPATCCLVNPDKEKTVEAAFQMVRRLSDVLREKYTL
jgi:hypothetical protein